MTASAKGQSNSRSTLTGALAILFLAAATGCARLPQDAGFEDVRKTVAERSGREISWRRGTDVDKPFAQLIHAALSSELTADAAAQVALLNNRKLQAVYSDLGIAHSDVVQAGTMLNPVLGGSIKGSISGSQKPELELALTDDFIHLLTLPLRKRIAKAKFESVKAHVTQEILALAFEVKGQFYIVQSEEQMLEMLRQVVAATDASLEVAQRLFNAGNIRALDLENERSLNVRARLDLASAEVSAMKSRERLNILMGLWGSDAEIRISSRLPETPADELPGEDIEKRVIEKSIELEMLRQEIVAMGGSLGLTRATALIPELGLGAAYKSEGSDSRLLGPAFSFPIPFFDQGRARVAGAKAELRRAQEAYFYKAVEVRAASRAARDHLRIARQRAAYSRDVAVPLQHRILGQTQLEYNAMQTGVFQLLLAKQGEIEAGKRYIEDLRDYWLARTEMESLLAGHVTMTGMETTALDHIMGSALH